MDGKENKGVSPDVIAAQILGGLVEPSCGGLLQAVIFEGIVPNPASKPPKPSPKTTKPSCDKIAS